MALTHKKFVNRTKVIWIGPIEDGAEFSNRGLRVEFCDESKALDHFPFASSLIINVVKTNRGRLAALLRQLAEPAMDHGLTIHVVADSDDTQNHVSYVLKMLDLTSDVNSSTKPKLSQLAESVARFEPGASCSNDLMIDDLGDPVEPIAELLLRRAFCDCKSITVSRLTGGMTANVLLVYAVFRDSRSGPRPLPFFAKVGSRSAIRAEQLIYTQYVEHFVPFYLRPSLDYDRCAFGCKRAILVGNFVEYSEPLSDVARRNLAQPAIHSVFDNALRGWRLQATEATNNIAVAMPDYHIPADIPATRLDEARKDGSVRTPQELETLLRKVLPISYLSAPCHGDLHAENIRVRGSDAILIDFQRVRQGPLLADHACLEISLAFNEFGKDRNDGWKDLIDTLYGEKHFEHPPRPPLEPAPREWLWNAVRQIRTIALANQLSNEYLQIVIMCLLRFARFGRRSGDTAIAETRKAYAYVIADRLTRFVENHA